MILFCCASELGLPDDLSAIEVILHYYYLSFWYSNCCESTKKLKDPFVKVESICLFVPIVDNFQYKKYSYLNCLLY